MRIVIAPQEFKGTLSPQQAAEAMAEGARLAVPGAEIDLAPLSDGGPGLVAAILASSPGRRMRTAAHDPLGRPLEAEWGLLEDGTAVIEMAAAAGLSLLLEEERDPRFATTYGVGELILPALDAGARRIIVGAGGSATNDGGAGMAAALGVRFIDRTGRELPPGGAALARLERIDVSALDPRLPEVEVTAAADVINPLCGAEGASIVYAPQKGASPEVAEQLDDALRRYGEVIERDLGLQVTDVPAGGAAGGLGAGLMAFLAAEILPGFEIVAETIRLRDRLRGADLVLTGEGRFDGQTPYGKAVARVAQMAREQGARVIAIVGTLGEGWGDALSLLDGVEPVAGSAATLEDALARPAALVAVTTQRALEQWLETAP